MQVIKFKSPSGRAVFNAIFSRPRTNQTELFQPGRTAFVYELEGGAAPDVPMTLRRSKADCPAVGICHFWLLPMPAQKIRLSVKDVTSYSSHLTAKQLRHLSPFHLTGCGDDQGRHGHLGPGANGEDHVIHARDIWQAGQDEEEGQAPDAAGTACRARRIRVFMNDMLC